MYVCTSVCDLRFQSLKGKGLEAWNHVLLSILYLTIISIYCSPVRKCIFQFSSVAQSCLTLCDPMNRSTPGLPVHHQLPEFTQTHIHRVSDAIQPSHPLSSPSPAPNPSQHQSLFQWVNSLQCGGFKRTLSGEKYSEACSRLCLVSQN